MVVDDGSPVDKSTARLKNGGKVFYLRNKKNLGWIYAVQKALEARSPDFFIPLGCGDTLLPGVFKRIQKSLDCCPEIGFMMWPIFEICEKHRNVTSLLNRFSLDRAPTIWEPPLFSAQCYGRAIIGQACFRTAAWKKVGGFRKELLWHADHFTCHLLGNQEKTLYFPAPLGTFLRSQGSYGSRSESSEQENLCKKTIVWLNRGSNRKIRDAMIRSGALCVFEHVLEKVLCKHPSKNLYLDLRMRRWLFLKKIRGWFRHPVPKSLKTWFRQAITSTRRSP